MLIREGACEEVGMRQRNCVKGGQEEEAKRRLCGIDRKQRNCVKGGGREDAKE